MTEVPKLFYPPKELTEDRGVVWITRGQLFGLLMSARTFNRRLALGQIPEKLWNLLTTDMQAWADEHREEDDAG